MNLLQASESGEVEVATNLLGQGANVNGTDATVRIPWLTPRRSRSCYSVLTPRRQQGKTPLHIAASA
eukprot:3810450-Rhodomonas_salina.1